jgi:hypothetical protein
MVLSDLISALHRLGQQSYNTEDLWGPVFNLFTSLGDISNVREREVTF